jgi:anti-sigma B factor antagonist
MTATVEMHGSVAHIILAGNLDYSTQDELRTATQRALSHKRAREIHVDFAGVMFLDSSVIRALIILQKEADAAGKSLILMNCNEFTREIFEIGGFDRMFTFR